MSRGKGGGGQKQAEIYGLYCPESGELRYIGKANDSKKRLASHMRDYKRRQTPVYDWIRSLAERNLIPVLKVLEVASDWDIRERELIAEHRENGARLLNLADGGDEPYCAKETRAANGKKVAATRNKYFWKLKLMLGQSLKAGYVNDSTRELIRSRPDVFGHLSAVA